VRRYEQRLQEWHWLRQLTKRRAITAGLLTALSQGTRATEHTYYDDRQPTQATTVLQKLQAADAARSVRISALRLQV